MYLTTTLLFLITLLLNGVSVQAQTVQATSSPGRYAIRRSAQETRTDHALLIANDSYNDPAYAKLVNPVFDARTLEVILREKFGFQTTLLTSANRDSCLR